MGNLEHFRVRTLASEMTYVAEGGGPAGVPPDPTQCPPGKGTAAGHPRRHFLAPSPSFVSILRMQESQMPVLTRAPSLVTRATQGFRKGQAREPPLPLVGERLGWAEQSPGQNCCSGNLRL